MDIKNMEEVLAEDKKNISEMPLQEDSADGQSERKAKFYEACYRLGEAKTVSGLKSVEQMFLQLEGYPDCDKRLEQCRAKIRELEEAQAEQDAENSQRLEKLRGEYMQLRDEAKRCEKILRKREAAIKISEISEKLNEDYAEIEGAQDYAREFAAKSKQLEQEFARRRRFEKISSAIAALVQTAVAAIYVTVFAKSGTSFDPTALLAVCDCIMFAGFMIGYFCESDAGTAASLFAAMGFVAMLIATISLCVIKGLALGASGYIRLLCLPIVIGAAVGAVLYIIWNRIAAHSEKMADKLRGKK